MVAAMSTAELTLNDTKPNDYRVPLRARLVLWYRNWRVRHIGKAVRTLTKAMRDDPDFARSWKCNIAMPIYDSMQGGPEINLIAANRIADRLMKHLFDVDTSQK